MQNTGLGFSLGKYRLAVPLIVWMLASSGRADLLIPSSFQPFATHPDAVMQATERGRTIANITIFDGDLYCGYGDWALDTGPMTIRSFDSTSGAWSASLVIFGSEAISHYRQLGSSLYAPKVDPLGAPGVNAGGYAQGVLNASGVAWSQADNVTSSHVFDSLQRAVEGFFDIRRQRVWFDRDFARDRFIGLGELDDSWNRAEHCKQFGDFR